MFRLCWLVIAIVCLVWLGLNAASPPANVKVNSVSSDIQNEEQIWISPADSDLVVAVWRDFRLGYRRVAIGASENGGNSWSDTLIQQGPLNFHSDPCLTGDQNGNFYMNLLNINNPSNLDSSTTIVYTWDGGQFTNWVGPTLVTPISAEYFEDKQFTTVDRTGGTYDGNYYTAWARFPNPNRIMFARSTDGAASFEDTILIGPAIDYPGCGVIDGGQFAIPVVDADGDVHVFWQRVGLESGCFGSYEIAQVTSTDGGLTFSPVKTAFKTTLGYHYTYFGGIDVYGAPMADCDISGGPHNNNIYIARTEFRGFTPTSGQTEIYLYRSTDKGATWLDPVRVNDDPQAFVVDSFHPWLTVSEDGVVLVLFYDGRQQPVNVIDCYFAASFDGGATFTTNYRVSDVSSPLDNLFRVEEGFTPTVYESDGSVDITRQGRVAPRAGLIAEYIGMHSYNETVNAIWTDTRDGTQDVYSARFRIPFLEPRLLTPDSNVTVFYQDIDFKWATCWHENADEYRLEISTDSNFITVDQVYTNIPANEWNLSELAVDTYYWRVKAFRTPEGDSTEYSDWRSFTTESCVDVDGDGFGEPGLAGQTCPEDNCPLAYNPTQVDSDLDGVGDACDIVFDTISTVCTKLILRNDGNFGYGGNSNMGGLNLDFSTSTECDPDENASYYLYDGSPVVGYLDGADTQTVNAAYPQSNWSGPLPAPLRLRQKGSGNPTEPVISTGNYESFNTGTVVTEDNKIGIEKVWWAPQQLDSCNFMIQCLKVYSHDGNSHSGLTLGEVVDWDIPSDWQINNYFGFDVSRRVVYQQGFDSTAGPFECIANETRFGGVAFLGYHLNGATIDTVTQPFGAQALEFDAYVAPNAGYDPSDLYPAMKTPGYTPTAGHDDLISLIVYLDNYTLDPGDTLYIYTSYNSVQGSAKSLADLLATVDKAKQWLVTYVLPAAFICGDANSDGNVSITDAVFIINYIFGGGTAPDPLEAAEVNCDGNVSISDAVYIINYIFGGGASPCQACP